MRVERMATAAAFLEAATPYLAASETAHALLLGLAGAAAADGTALPHAAVARDDAGAVVGAALRTRDRLVLSREGAPGAAAALARDALAPDAAPPAVTGALVPAESADAFVAATGEAWRTLRREGIHEARVVIAPPPVRGAMRAAAAADRETLAAWVAAFGVEAAGEPLAPDAAARVVDGRAAAGALHVWDVDGRPVSLAAWAGPTPHGVRVNLVYTPPPMRGRGYAAALVAALTRRLLDGGRDVVFLHTDLANPTANGVYRRIGYAMAAEAVLLARG